MNLSKAAPTDLPISRLTATTQLPLAHCLRFRLLISLPNMYKIISERYWRHSRLMRLFLKPSPVVLVSHFYQTFRQFHAPHRWVNAPRIQAEWAKNVVRVSWTFHQRYLRLAKQIVATILDITDETAGVNSNEWALSLQTGMNMDSYWIATQSKNWTNNEAPHHFAKKKKVRGGGSPAVPELWIWAAVLGGHYRGRDIHWRTHWMAFHLTLLFWYGCQHLIIPALYSPAIPLLFSRG